jgi:N-acetylglutamate synthase-like GNAT family acetyltransferase
MVAAALEHARSRGATLVEACPHEPRGGRMPDVFAWTGIASTFFANGFREVGRRSPSRPYVRKEVAPHRSRR